MPTYEYRCKACSRELEVVQSFSDDSLTTCEACGGELRKLFGNVGIAFKGTGFYKNDSRDKAKRSTTNGDKAGADKGTGDTGSSDKASADKASADTSSGSSSTGKDGGTGAGGGSDAKSAAPAKKSPAASTSKSS